MTAPPTPAPSGVMERVAELERLVAAMTPDGWQWLDFHLRHMDEVVYTRNAERPPILTIHGENHWQRRNDAEGIVALRNSALPLILELASALAEARASLDVAERALMHHGYRKSCDVPACNCGDQWHHGGHAMQRLMEIARVVPHNGVTLLSAIEKLAEARAGALEEAATVAEDLAEHGNHIAEAIRALALTPAGRGDE